MSQHDIQLDSCVVEPQLEEPKKYEVLLLNDDYTTMDFVIEVLMSFFEKNFTQAEQIMLTVHNKGQAVCGIYCKEIAEMRVEQVTEYAQKHEFPLLCIKRVQ